LTGACVACQREINAARSRPQKEKPPLTLISRKQAKQLGLSKYYTGRVCSRAHRSEHFTGSGRCSTCHNELNLRRRRALFCRGIIISADPDRGKWLVQCGKDKAVFPILIGDIDDQQENIPRMITGAVIEFSLFDNFLAENISVVS
jgi:hypothetical protein